MTDQMLHQPRPSCVPVGAAGQELGGRLAGVCGFSAPRGSPSRGVLQLVVLATPTPLLLNGRGLVADGPSTSDAVAIIIRYGTRVVRQSIDASCVCTVPGPTGPRLQAEQENCATGGASSVVIPCPSLGLNEALIPSHARPLHAAGGSWDLLAAGDITIS